MKRLSRRELLGLALAAPAVRVLAADEAAWPARPILLIMPGGPGGVADLRARWLAERLAPALGQPVIVENKPGAGGNIGMEVAARSAPDGYTLVVAHQGVLSMNPHLYRHTGYDALADFAPITRVGVGPLLLAVHPSIPARSVRELIQLAKAQPGRMSFGSPGVGTPPHLAGELFNRMAGIEALHVPYRGGASAAADLVGGHISWTIEGTNVQLPQIQAGRLRALAVTGPRRIAVLPDVPTVAESGLPGYEFTGWVGIAAPARTPRPVLERLYAECARILQAPAAREWFASYGLAPGGDTPEAFAALVREEYQRWGRFIRDAGLRVD